jgi:hypothetical protein
MKRVSSNLWFAAMMLSAFLISGCGRSAPEKETLDALEKVRDATRSGENFGRYSKLVTEAAASMNAASKSNDPGWNELSTCLADFQSVKGLWERSPKTFDVTLSRIIHQYWSEASCHLDNAHASFGKGAKAQCESKAEEMVSEWNTPISPPVAATPQQTEVPSHITRAPAGPFPDPDRIKIGMSKADFGQWARPLYTSIIAHNNWPQPDTQEEKWHYGNGLAVYFVDGKVTRVDKPVNRGRRTGD